MSDAVIIQMLNSQMSYMTQRQSVLAQNMANIDTPNYSAMDLKKLDFADMASSASNHMAMRSASGGKSLDGSLADGGHFGSDKLHKAYDVNPTGNNVVLEEQMAKISDTGAQFEIASSLYKKFNALYNTAVGKNS